MKTLILGQIPDDFSLEKYIPLGAFCFVGKEDIYQDWEKLDFSTELINDGEQLKKWDNLTNEYLNILIKEYADIFNKKYGYNYSINFWYDILNSYLLTLIQLIYSKEQHLFRVIEKYKNEKINVQIISDNINWQFKDTTEFIVAVAGDLLLNEWFYSRIIEKNLPENWKCEYVDKSHLYQPNKKQQQINLKSKIINWLVYSRSYLIYGLNIYEQFILNVYLSLKLPIKNTTERKQIICKKTNINLHSDIHKLISNTIPLSICNINLLVDKYLKRNYKAGKLNLGSQMLTVNDNAKVLSALCYEAQEVIIGVQHGGHDYGSAKNLNFIGNTEYVHHTFITWGYKEQEDYNNFQPLPSPLLSKLVNKHKQQNSKIILVGTKAFAHSFRFDNSLQGKQWIDYRNNKVLFIKNLSADTFSNFYYRPYFNDIGAFCDKEYYKRNIPNLKLHKSKKFTKDLVQSNLLVLDHPGTTLNIALAANVPTICFWKKEYFHFCRQAIPFFEELEKVGILFTDQNYSINAANKVNEIADNVQEWWQQPHIQTAKNNWTQNYALAKRSWRLDWLKYLWKL